MNDLKKSDVPELGHKLYSKFHDIQHDELNKFEKKFKKKNRIHIQQLTQNIVSQLYNPIIKYALENESPETIETIEKMFKLK